MVLNINDWIKCEFICSHTAFIRILHIVSTDRWFDNSGRLLWFDCQCCTTHVEHVNKIGTDKHICICIYIESATFHVPLAEKVVNFNNLPKKKTTSIIIKNIRINLNTYIHSFHEWPKKKNVCIQYATTGDCMLWHIHTSIRIQPYAMIMMPKREEFTKSVTWGHTH